MNMLYSMPYGVLLQITQHLPAKDLFNTCIVCRRFNHFVFPVFFRRFNITIDNTIAKSINLTLPFDNKVLSALRVAFFVTSTDCFSCVFLQLAVECGAFHHDAERVVDLLIPSPSRSFNAAYVHLKMGVPRFQFDHKRLCEGLFVRAKHCHRIVFTYTSSTRRYDRTHIPHTSFIKHQNVYQRVLSVTGASNTRDKPHPFGPRRLKSNLLNAFGKHKPKFVLYALQVLTNNGDELEKVVPEVKTIHKLELKSDIKSVVWLKTLSRVANAAHQLTALTLDAQGIFPRDLLKFINQLPKLTVLTIRISDDCYGTYKNRWDATTQYIDDKLSPKLSLPSLVVLIAPPNLAATIIGAKLPKLRTLSIHVNEPGRLFSPHVQRSFTRLKSHLEARPRPSLETNVYLYFNEPSTSFPNVRGMANDLTGFFQRGIGSDSPISWFSAIVIDVSPIPRQSGDHSVLILTQWLRLFKGLRHLTFTGIASHRHSFLPTVEHNLFPLFRAINVQCPRIETVEFQQHTYDVVQYIRGHEGRGKTLHQTQSFEDLNEDIFYLIFQYLDTNEIYSLLGICRNLRNWALPAYLRRRGIPNPSRYTHITMEADGQETLTDLSALLLSSHETTQTLSLQISPRVSLFVIFELLHRFLRLVRKLSKIEKVILDFGTCSEPDELPKFSEIDPSKVVWTELMLSILNTLAEKTKAMSFHGHGSLSGITSFPSSLGEGIGEGNHLTPTWKVNWPLKHTLTNLALNDHALNYPLFEEWVKKVLWKSESITDLSIMPLKYGRLKEITASLPRISSLKVIVNEEAFYEVLEAIPRFPPLLHLSILASAAIDIDTSHPVPPLPQLRTLVTMPEYLALFLNDESSLPELETLTIVLPSSRLFSEHTRKILKSLAHSLQILQARPNFSSFFLTVALPSAEESDGALEATSGEWKIIAPLTKGLVLLQPVDPALYGVSPSVFEMAQSLRRWLCLFSSLEFLDIRWRGESHLLDAILQHLDISNICCALQSIWVNGEIRLRSESVNHGISSLDDYHDKNVYARIHM